MAYRETCEQKGNRVQYFVVRDGLLGLVLPKCALRETINYMMGQLVLNESQFFPDTLLCPVTGQCETTIWFAPANDFLSIMTFALIFDHSLLLKWVKILTNLTKDWKSTESSRHLKLVRVLMGSDAECKCLLDVLEMFR